MLRRNVLIFHSGALGDFVLTFPLAVAVARVYAQSRIFYVTSSQRGALVDAMLRLEWVDAEDGWHRLFAPDAEFPARAHSLLAGATTVFALQAPPGIWLENVRRMNPAARIIVVDPTVPEHFHGHAAQWALNQLAGYPVEHSATEQILRSLGSRGLAGAHTGGGGIVIHPGAGSPAKCWPLKSFIELGRRLRAAGQVVRFAIGEVERDRWSETERSQMTETFQTVQPTTLLELYRLLIHADAFIGNDSGPSHLAAIAGTPTVALFGPTAPETWKPLGPAVVTLRGEPIGGIGVDQVEAEARRMLSTLAEESSSPAAEDDDD